MTQGAGNDWNPGTYLRFQGFRLRPALDLLSAVPDLPDGDLVDLGCGPGTVGSALLGRFPMRRLIGVDTSPAMLEQAQASGVYTTFHQADIAEWVPDRRPALIFSNAALHWLPDHGWLLPRLLGQLAPGGCLAVQMPRQSLAPAHRILRDLAAVMFPDRFDWSNWEPAVAVPEAYASLLSPLGELSLWETVYYQRLAPTPEGNPVRLFSQSTVARPILEVLTEAETEWFLSAVDSSLAEAYPASPDGSVLYPFRRLFLTICRPD